MRYLVVLERLEASASGWTQRIVAVEDSINPALNTYNRYSAAARRATSDPHVRPARVRLLLELACSEHLPPAEEPNHA